MPIRPSPRPQHLLSIRLSQLANAPREPARHPHHRRCASDPWGGGGPRENAEPYHYRPEHARCYNTSPCTVRGYPQRPPVTSKPVGSEAGPTDGADGAMYIVEAVDLTKIYHNRYISLNALNLRVEKGMVYGFVGPNGAGKSTHLPRPARPPARHGRGHPRLRRIDEHRARRPAPPHRASCPPAVLPAQHDADLLPAVRRQHPRHAPGPQPDPPSPPCSRPSTSPRSAAQRIEGLSTGMVTRLGIAAALMNDPELLVLDEPTSGLDLRPQADDRADPRALGPRPHDHHRHHPERRRARLHRRRHHRAGAPHLRRPDGRDAPPRPPGHHRRRDRGQHVQLRAEDPRARRPRLDPLGALGSEFHITFLGTETMPVYLQRVLQLMDRTGVDLLHLDTGSHEIEEAFLQRLEEDGTRGFLRASAWAATQQIAATSTPRATRSSTTRKQGSWDAGIPRPPAP